MTHDDWLMSGPGGPHDDEPEEYEDPVLHECGECGKYGCTIDHEDEVQEIWNPDMECYEPYRPIK